MRRGNYKNVKPGEGVSATQWNAMQAELKRLANIRGAIGSGIEVRNTPSGITIGADIQPAADMRPAIARKEGGDAIDWYSLQEWSETEHFDFENQQHTIYDFEFVEPAWSSSVEDDFPNTEFPWTTTGEYVRAPNLTGHYVPHWQGTHFGTYVVWLTKRGGLWHVNYMLPSIIRINFLEDLFPNQYANCGSNIGALRVYEDGFLESSQRWNAGMRGHAYLTRENILGSSLWKYVVFNMQGCPIYDDSPGEEE